MNLAGKLDLSLLELPSQANPDNKLVAFFRAQGAAASEIAEILGVDEKRVKVILDQEQTTDLVFRMQRALGLTPHVMLKNFATAAVETRIKLMLHGQSEAIRSNSASDVLDRVMGKAVQTVHNFHTDMDGRELASVDQDLSRLHERLDKLEEQRNALIETGTTIDVDVIEEEPNADASGD